MRKTLNRGFAVWCSIALFSPAFAAPQDTDLADVTADIAFVRQYDGVMHVGIVLHNAGKRQAASSQAVDYSKVVVIDPKANKKYFPLKDANGHFLAGPISDWNGGGRWFPRLLPNSDTVMWVLFDAVSQGDAIRIEAPMVHAFENLNVTAAPPPAHPDVASILPPLRASLQSAKRAAGQFKVRLKLVNPEKKHVRLGLPALRYADVYALDPQGKRSYPLLKGDDGRYLATPQSDKNDGGRWFLSYVQPNGQALLDLTFQAPPDSVKTVDVIVPQFAPFEHVAIEGRGGAAPSGIAVAGRAAELQRAMKELKAEETPMEIKVNLSADLLFDFDKADIKATAEPELQKVLTVLKSYPNAQVMIEGHTDGKGSDRYNQTLSERRANGVAQWLTAHGNLNGAQIKTRGWGKSRPIAPNTRPDGSDNPEGRAKNRRVEITVTKS
jgi:outer membrane protein OmpA-like peptidoglycan-associated protein